MKERTSSAHSIRQQGLHWYFSVRNSWPVWFYVLNRKARAKFVAHPPKLSPLQRRLVEDLNRDGIAVTSLEELFPGENMLQTLTGYTDSIKEKKHNQTKKEFLEDFWELKPELDPTNPFLNTSLRPQVLDVANSYMRMWTRLNYYHLATTLPAIGDPAHSQRWHRDPEESRMCKMFIYLNDVDMDTGPFTYVKKSTPSSGQKYSHLFPQDKPLGSYPPKEKVEKAIDPTDIIPMTGKAGTVLFCDTSGLHYGGYAKKKPRTMFTSFYTSDVWSEPKRYTYPSDIKKRAETLPREVRYALFLE